MKLQKLALLAAVALSATACANDAGPFLAPARSQAYVRWVNAVPDTFALNLRFVDNLAGSAWWEPQNFRFVGNYQGVDAGSRAVKVFGSGTDINTVGQVFTDMSITLVAGKYYTLMSTGSARAGNVTLTLIEDTRATPGTQIAVKAINAGFGSAIDAYAVATATTAISGTPAIANVANLASSAYTNLATGSLAFRVTNAGTTTIQASALAPTGAAAASPSESAQGGYSIAGSMMTAFVFPRSVAGSAAPQTTAFQSPAVIWIQDNRP